MFTGTRDRKAGNYTARLTRGIFKVLEAQCDSPFLDGDLYPDYSNPSNPQPYYRSFSFSSEWFGDNTVGVYRGGRVQELAKKGAWTIGLSIDRLLRFATGWKLVGPSA